MLRNLLIVTLVYQKDHASLIVTSRWRREGVVHDGLHATTLVTLTSPSPTFVFGGSFLPPKYTKKLRRKNAACYGVNESLDLYHSLSSISIAHSTTTATTTQPIADAFLLFSLPHFLGLCLLSSAFRTIHAWAPSILFMRVNQSIDHLLR